MGVLQDTLQNYIGSEVFYRMPLTNIIYTEGVKAFAELGNAYWALTDISIMYKFKFHSKEFLSITVTSTGKRATIEYTDGDCNVLKRQHYKYTDLEKGKYKFYLTDNTLLLTTEY